MSAPIIIAHRGLHAVHPENSLPAFRAAVRAGIEWVECDVQQSLDGFPVILHDDTLGRATIISGRVDRHRADEIAHLRLHDHLGRPSDALVPVLWSRRDGLAGIGASLLVEIKPPAAAWLVARTAEVMRANHLRWMIQSFDRANLHIARRSAPGIARALLIDKQSDLLSALDERWPALHVGHGLVDAELVRLMHEQGRMIGVWTVNEKSDLRRMIELGVDRIITDEPIVARSLLGM
ncbi:MAG: hypothetical protein H7Z14_05935 [Anaerolineae bacterium]|nr:hypothetical protein [Phycisphaerae bacterium]